MLKVEWKVYFPQDLDKWTSGLVVVALQKHISSALSASLVDGDWDQRYHLIAQIPPCMLENSTISGKSNK